MTRVSLKELFVALFKRQEKIRSIQQMLHNVIDELPSSSHVKRVQVSPHHELPLLSRRGR